MKVCLVNSFYPPYIGGAETYVSNLARNLVNMGHIVAVYCADSPMPPGATRDGNVIVVRMKTPLAFYGTPLARFPSSFLSERWDIIHCNFPNPYFAGISAAISKVKHIPAVLTWHNDFPSVSSAASLLAKLHDMISPLYVGVYQRIIATTETYANTSRILLANRMKVQVIPNGVDTDRFNPDVDSRHIREKYHLNGYKTVVFVGALTRWHWYKGVAVLIEAFAIAEKSCAALKLVIVGGGDRLSYYRKLAGMICESDHVVFTGPIPEDELPAIYTASDFVVLPSVNSSEGFGLVLLEAMACGKAVIGSDIGGIPGVIKHGQNGVLVRPGDPHALARAICDMYEDEEFRLNMGRAGREYSRSHDWKAVASVTENLYKELV